MNIYILEVNVSLTYLQILLVNKTLTIDWILKLHSNTYKNCTLFQRFLICIYLIEVAFNICNSNCVAKDKTNKLYFFRIKNKKINFNYYRTKYLKFK